MFVAIDGQAAGLIAVADPVRRTTHEALIALRDEGVRVVMLTGDIGPRLKLSRASWALMKSKPR